MDKAATIGSPFRKCYIKMIYYTLFFFYNKSDDRIVTWPEIGQRLTERNARKTVTLNRIASDCKKVYLSMKTNIKTNTNLLGCFVTWNV
jgi:hypothetical protein